MKKLLRLALLGLLLCGCQTEAAARETYSLNDGWRTTCYPEGREDSLVQLGVNLPHNWDGYYGSRQYEHGNMHGSARYERQFTLHQLTRVTNGAAFYDKMFTLQLEGAGTYVTIWVNGKQVTNHQPAGRVVTTVNITPYLHISNPGVKNTLVITCDHPSGIEDMPWVCGGCTEGSTSDEGSAPMGLFRNVSLEVTDALRVEPFGVHVWANPSLDTLYVDTEIRNNSPHGEAVVLQTMVGDKMKRVTFQMGSQLTKNVYQAIPVKEWGLKRWSPDDPQTYTVTTVLIKGSQHNIEADRVKTETGFADVNWLPYLHGVCDEEQMLGTSHALTNEEIDHRCQVMKQLGFNTVHEAHHPHNLRFAAHWMEEGMLWWPQFSTRVWHDTPAFRENYLTLLKQWVRERRNNPSLIRWGLQTVPTMPEDFVEECKAVIRQMDPLCERPGMRGGRKITVKDEGIYGVWRTAGLHDRQDRMEGEVDPQGAWSEEHQCLMLHQHLCKAWKDHDHVEGRFVRAMSSQECPGRPGPDEFMRVIDKVGPLDNCGIMTINWKPTDAYYLYRAWGEYFGNKRQGDPTKMTSREMVKLGYDLEQMPQPDYLLTDASADPCSNPELHRFAHQTQLLKPDEGRTYLYRYNCGGDQEEDSWGNIWQGDDTRISTSWAMAQDFADDNLCPVLASQALVNGWVGEAQPQDEQLLAAEKDQLLLRSYRFGRQELKFSFPVPTVEQPYQVDLWFVNQKNQVKRLSYKVKTVQDGTLTISFPRLKVGQAEVSAIAISLDKSAAKKLGKLDKDGHFVFKPGLLNYWHPALARESGFPYSEELNWEKINHLTIMRELVR